MNWCQRCHTYHESPFDCPSVTPAGTSSAGIAFLVILVVLALAVLAAMWAFVPLAGSG